MNRKNMLALTMALAAVIPACTESRSVEGYYWNPNEEYGTRYPEFMKEISFSENGKGFSVTDGTAVLWADCTLMICPDEWPASLGAPDEDGLVYPSQVLMASGADSDLYIVNDTVYTESSVTVHFRLAAYGDRFFMLSYSYPEGNEMYSSLDKECFDTFPEINLPSTP